MIPVAIALVIAYFIGAIPTGYIFSRLSGGVDIRKVGSGNVGATNVYRTMGKKGGFLVLAIDIFKGAFPVFILPFIFRTDMMSTDLFRMFIGMAAISGHIWTIFLNFKGGKGVATTAGVILVITPKILLAALIVWIILFTATRYVSVASIGAAISLPIMACVLRKPGYMIAVFSVLCLVGIVKHKANIERLLKGKENKI